MSDQNVPQNSSVSGSNGEYKTQPDKEEKMKTYTQGKLEDFSQSRINRGQQRINYLVAEVDEKIVDALRKLTAAIAKSCNNVDVGPLNHAIDEVAAATEKIAGEFPPGCTDPN